MTLEKIDYISEFDHSISEQHRDWVFLKSEWQMVLKGIRNNTQSTMYPSGILLCLYMEQRIGKRN